MASMVMLMGLVKLRRDSTLPPETLMVKAVTLELSVVSAAVSWCKLKAQAVSCVSTSPMSTSIRSTGNPTEGPGLALVLGTLRVDPRGEW